MTGDDPLLRWRDEFPILQRCTYLVSNSLGAMPRAAYDALRQYADEWASEGVSACWKEWQDMVMVPGLPWYPGFVAYPGPSASPTPNIPMPLICCPSPMMAKMTPTMLKDAMERHVRRLLIYHRQVHDLQ